MDKPGLPWGPQDDANALKVRRALNMAIDKQDIVDNLYGGQGAVFGWPWPDWPEFAGIFEPLETYPPGIQELFQYNPEKAKQLLKEAGYPNGFRAVVTTTSASVDFAAILKDYLSKVGVELVIDARDTGVMNTLLRDMSYPEMIIDINRMSQSPVRYHGARLPSIWNYAFFETATTRAAYDEANLYLGRDDSKVAQAWKSISQHYLEKASLVMLPEQYTNVAWWPWLKRWDGAGNIGSWHPDGALYWLWIDQDLKKSMGY
jgi:peptide/nickel transport system substrate-binding protein